MESRQTFAFIGAVLLMLGVFMPIASVPVVGNINLFQNGEGDGLYILILTIPILLLILAKKFGWALIPAGIIALLLFYDLVSLRDRIFQAKAEITRNAQGTMLEGFSNGLAQSVQMQWGWAILGLGIIFIIVAPIAIVKKKTN